MKGNDARVLLDLNYPGFQSELFDLDAPELKKKKLRGLHQKCIFMSPTTESCQILPIVELG